MATIDIDFEVYKALTALRPSEETTYNEVIRRLLKLKTPAAEAPPAAVSGADFKGVWLPDGTQFKVSYKGKAYTARIQSGQWIGDDGVQRNSPSDAACAITKTNVNGWRFWKVKRPQDTSWRLLDELRAA